MTIEHLFPVSPGFVAEDTDIPPPNIIVLVSFTILCIAVAFVWIALLHSWALRSHCVPTKTSMDAPKEASRQQAFTTRPTHSSGPHPAATPYNDAEARAVQELSRLMEAKDSALLSDAMQYAAPKESETELLLRHIRARNNKPALAMKMIIKDLQWRRDKKVLEMRTCRADDVLGCDPAKVQSWFPHGMIGFDFKKRPVVYKNYGAFMPSKLLNEEILPHTTVEKLVDYDIWVTERLITLLSEEAQGFVVVLDLKGWSLFNLNKTGMWYCKALADAGAPHYPERLGQMFIINAPRIFVSTFNVINSWLDRRTQDKIQLLGPIEDYRPKLEKAMPWSIIPKLAGGEADLPGSGSFMPKRRSS